jgi:hypothetical protein
MLNLVDKQTTERQRIKHGGDVRVLTRPLQPLSDLAYRWVTDRQHSAVRLIEAFMRREYLENKTLPLFFIPSYRDESCLLHVALRQQSCSA